MGERPYRGRTSRQRDDIAALIDRFATAFSAEDVSAAAGDAGVAVGTATVYRTLSAMEATGYIESVGSRAGATLYARCHAQGHHHHLVCESCGRVEEAPCTLGGTIEHAATRGFSVRRHEVALYGLCRECAAGEGRG